MTSALNGCPALCLILDVVWTELHCKWVEVKDCRLTNQNWKTLVFYFFPELCFNLT